MYRGLPFLGKVLVSAKLGACGTLNTSETCSFSRGWLLVEAGPTQNTMQIIFKFRMNLQDLDLFAKNLKLPGPRNKFSKETWTSG
jgi:hypothetical protein